MKTLALSLLILINTAHYSIAQENSETKNQISINTTYEDGAIVLNWESNREVNSSYYLIEKSINGQAFEIISTQKASSSTYSRTAYSFEDTTVESNIAQYRVTLVLMDGSRITSLSKNLGSENLAKAIAN